MEATSHNGGGHFIRKWSDAFYKLESDNNILNQMDAKTATQILEKQQKSKVEMSLNKRILRSLTIFSSNTSIHGLRFVAAHIYP
jgi:hypothetical protein